jgi:hypothetical protein
VAGSNKGAVRIFMGKYIRYTDEFLARVREDADLVGIIGRDIAKKGRQGI